MTGHGLGGARGAAAAALTASARAAWSAGPRSSAGTGRGRRGKTPRPPRAPPTHPLLWAVTQGQARMMEARRPQAPTAMLVYTKATGHRTEAAMALLQRRRMQLGAATSQGLSGESTPLHPLKLMIAGGNMRARAAGSKGARTQDEMGGRQRGGGRVTVALSNGRNAASTSSCVGSPVGLHVASARACSKRVEGAQGSISPALLHVDLRLANPGPLSVPPSWAQVSGCLQRHAGCRTEV